MITAIKGKIFEIFPGEVHLETGGGFVVRVLCPVPSYTKIKQIEYPQLYTVFKIKDEEALLYGFLLKKEKLLFEKLISISGVGGKTALSFVSAFSVEELIEAIDGGNLEKICSIPGIGKKTAQRIILELTGKLKFDVPLEEGAVKLREDLVSGLVNLGYPLKGVRDLVGVTLQEEPENQSFEDLFKKLLKKISRI